MDTPKPQEGLHGNSAYNALLNEIRDGHLSPGDRLRETELAKRFNISRTPVREAIRLLEADGLVTHLPRVGATIRRLDYSEVMELYEMRVVLECTAARMAARAASDVEIAELSAISEMLAQVGEGTEASRLNRQFHLALLNAAKNRFLTKSMFNLQKAMLILGRTTLADPERYQNAILEHQAILEALTRRDGEAAETAMHDHIIAGQRARIRALRVDLDNPNAV
ncbi:GntR family transcriptional regulator [Shimia sp. MMG029]|uniref:GntR family transcriptional regulator n=1 Tax=Shimia sp. MMG029 TaxID=3021978 RepID=UPI0022FDD889|nr:GntR family transcriptional regulator [Shimia sp. MMG029]MDA5555151.1 GntR family transcriptional regulator [Shimia sp. MMG029]